MSNSLYSPWRKPRKSVYRGQEWLAFRPGEDSTFKKSWVSRSKSGALHTVVNSRKDLITNAELCEVKLIWKRSLSARAKSTETRKRNKKSVALPTKEEEQKNLVSKTLPTEGQSESGD